MDNRVAGSQPPTGATPILRFGLPSPPGVAGMVMAPGSASGKHPFYVVCALRGQAQGPPGPFGGTTSATPLIHVGALGDDGTVRSSSRTPSQSCLLSANGSTWAQGAGAGWFADPPLCHAAGEGTGLRAVSCAIRRHSWGALEGWKAVCGCLGSWPGTNAHGFHPMALRTCRLLSPQTVSSRVCGDGNDSDACIFVGGWGWGGGGARHQGRVQTPASTGPNTCTHTLHTRHF